ncbi:hypothetical protein CANTEDRAFT_131403 [Yamadazyma tenuis ATCC 10573]|uniref:Uncharacterized protein n=1 Tax=Candida tenuis (strain ATCC 10573 / BCRC 21748 / CBS 615 / JCM 9827 / NBRC 10315 / NRRL Y-1498 / VKM Y-70) TaxID=590646 RepID=G3B9Q4_CANTC|nr:uncharacterized protein CANTEDRAFT_131403 [Yamadazyma tenuis ATCC 10573]EGV61945.1 hypothetical protein CANTEDRAFT_131403 [Yamadazyma tenuis ATCC 10573]
MVAHTKADKSKHKVNNKTAKRKKLTQSSRKHAFKSFKDRVDSIKIEPNLNLSRRVYDDVEDTSSHFISTLHHWKEVNLSGNFTSFTDDIKSVCQSLPQVIYHQQSIFDSLYKHLEKYDAHSVQALLEVLSQFIHDLGSDFMVHYEKTLRLLTTIALDIKANDLQNNTNASNLLEWIFNCLTFIFKYLSRDLVQSFEPSFEILLPILCMNKQQYISRFCSEALSFIIKKMDSKQLSQVVRYLLVEKIDLIMENITFKDSSIVLFSEAITSSGESFHSKASIIYERLIETSFTNLNSNIIISGVLANLFQHGSQKSVEQFISITLKHMTYSLETSSHLSEENLTQIIEIFITLVFSESGKKVLAWEPIISMAYQISDKILEMNKDLNIDAFLFSLSTLTRNCDLLTINKSFRKLFAFLMKYQNGSRVIPFVDSTLKICEKKLLNLGLTTIFQEFINNSSTNESILRQLSLFLMKNPTFQVVIPEETCEYLTKSLDLKVSKHENLLNIYWKLNVVKFNVKNVKQLPLAEFVQSLKTGSLFIGDFIGILISFTEPTETFIDYLSSNFDSLKISSVFLDAFSKVVTESSHSMKKNKILEIIGSVADNFSKDDTTLRLSSVDFIIKILTVKDLECPEFICSIKVIETIPLTLGNARDIQLRIRMLVNQFNSLENKSDLDCKIISNYFFGILNNRFQPCWAAVFENLPRIVGVCEKYLWKLSYQFVTFDYLNQDTDYLVYGDDDMLVDDSIPETDLSFNDDRITSSFNSLLENSYRHFRSGFQVLISLSQSFSTNMVYEERMRALAIECWHKIPELAESNNQSVSGLILDRTCSQDWGMKDRNLLLTTFTKFKSLKTIKDADRLYQLLLNILTSQRLVSQKLALDVILNYKIHSLSNYRDNLKNLLDDTLFKDELTKFITNEQDSSIEAEDMDVLMPLILRILFGRVQGGAKSNSKASRKNAVINILPSLNQEHIIAFLKLGYDKIGFKDLNSISMDDFSNIKRINGFVALLYELYDVLGFNFANALSTSIDPLVYSISVAQLRINTAGEDNFEAEDEENINDDEGVQEDVNDSRNEIKSAKRIRQLGLRCLNTLFKNFGELYDWPKYFNSIYSNIIKPRLNNFDRENLQQPSSLTMMMVSWLKLPSISKFLMVDDLKPSRAIISLLENRKAKDPVVAVALGFAIDCLQSPFRETEDDSFITLLAILVESLLKNLPDIIGSTLDIEVINKSVTILLLLIDGDYIVDDSTRNSLIDSLCKVFNKPPNKVALDDREKILLSLSILINDYNGSLDDFFQYYKILSRSFRTYKEKSIRTNLVEVFKSLGSKFTDLIIVGELLDGMNSYAINSSSNRLGEPNYEAVLKAYKDINDTFYLTLSPVQWLPILYCALFFINDEEELIIRTNAGYVLNHFIDAYSSRQTIVEASELIELFKTIILPEIRDGLKLTVEAIQTEYINVLAYCVKNSKHFTDLDDMRVLLFEHDQEASFFANINHIQLHRRQRAIRRVGELRENLEAGSISHYILPIIENYAYNTDEKMRNISNEAVTSLGLLIRNVSWNQIKSFFKRYIAKLRVSPPENLRTCVHVVVEVSSSLFVSLPKDESLVDTFILGDIMPILQKILNERNDETIVNRIVLSEALVNLVKCLPETKIDEQLPGLLTSTCQVLRSRSEELRDSSRKSLCKIASSLGAKYFKFLLQELKSALTRGSQIHVLSYTMHSLLVSIMDNLVHGDLDDSVTLIVEIIMEDIFGAAGQEKDAEGYTSKMKEVKYKKSFDSGEMLTANISLTTFNQIIDPAKLILQERISLKMQNKLDELLRRYALGLNHNEESDSRNILILSYQINRQSSGIFEETNGKKNQCIGDKLNFETTGHFMVKLNARPLKIQSDFSQYKFTLQRFSFELLRAAISRHSSLLTVSSMQQFIPLLEEGINSGHEGLISTCLRLLHTFVQLPFPDETNQVFKKCARKALTFIKDSPNTTNEVCQSSLKLLTTLIRHKSDVNLKDSAISYVLERILPDLEEPKTQGLAFNFLKAVVSQHILLPEVYDVMDVVSKIMIVNHNREIREIARSIFFQFLMEYDQGRGKLEKQFKFLVNNLGYATQDGRQSVLELINSIVEKSGEELLNKVSSSFFVALANILVNDDSSRCREMSSMIITKMMQNSSESKLEQIEQYLTAWLKQDQNTILTRCALNVYKVYFNQFGLGKSGDIDDLVFQKLKEVFEKSDSQTSSDVSNAEDVEWQLVYSCLNIFATICNKEKRKVVGEAYKGIWKTIINTLLFPHSWVRLSSSRLIGVLLSNLDKCSFKISDYEVQTIAYRLLHQMSAPGVSDDLGNQIIKNLVLIAMRWMKNNTQFIHNQAHEDNDSVEKNEIRKSKKYELANEFLIHRACSTIRQDSHNSLSSKKSTIKLCAMLIQIFDDEFVVSVSEELVLSLYNYVDTNSNGNVEPDLVEIAGECLQMLENKMGSSTYSQVYADVQRTIYLRRQERRTRRAQLAVTNPDISARRKLKKHEKSREKRKHEKDENGYYHSKRKRY